MAWDFTNIVFFFITGGETVQTMFKTGDVIRLLNRPPTEKAWFKVVAFHRARWDTGLSLMWKFSTRQNSPKSYHSSLQSRSSRLWRALSFVVKRYFFFLLSNVVVKLTNTARIKTIELCSHPTWTFTIWMFFARVILLLSLCFQKRQRQIILKTFQSETVYKLKTLNPVKKTVTKWMTKKRILRAKKTLAKKALVWIVGGL